MIFWHLTYQQNREAARCPTNGRWKTQPCNGQRDFGAVLFGRNPPEAVAYVEIWIFPPAATIRSNRIEDVGDVLWAVKQEALLLDQLRRRPGLFTSFRFAPLCLP